MRFSEEVDEKAMREVLSSMVGRSYNVPPKESAVKVRVRSRVFNHIDLLDIDQSSRIIVVEVFYEAGRTYVPSLGFGANSRIKMRTD